MSNISHRTSSYFVYISLILLFIYTIFMYTFFLSLYSMFVQSFNTKATAIEYYIRNKLYIYNSESFLTSTDIRALYSPIYVYFLKREHDVNIFNNSIYIPFLKNTLKSTFKRLTEKYTYITKIFIVKNKKLYIIIDDNTIELLQNPKTLLTYNKTSYLMWHKSLYSTNKIITVYSITPDKLDATIFILVDLYDYIKQSISIFDINTFHIVSSENTKFNIPPCDNDICVSNISYNIEYSHAKLKYIQHVLIYDRYHTYYTIRYSMDSNILLYIMYVIVSYSIILLICSLLYIALLYYKKQQYIIQQHNIIQEQNKEIYILYKAIETTSIGITISDKDHNIVYVNNADAQQHGYTKQELIGKPSSIYGIVSDNTNNIDNIMYKRKTINIRKDGTTFTVFLSSDDIYDKVTQEYIGRIVACTDITHDEKQQEYIKFQQILLQTTIDSIPDIIYMVDTSKNKIVVINKAGLSILHLSSYDDLYNCTDHKKYIHLLNSNYNNILNILQKEQEYIQEEKKVYDNTEYYMVVYYIMLSLYPKYCIIINKDITDYKLLLLDYQDLQNSYKKLVTYSTQYLQGITQQNEFKLSDTRKHR